jgi:CheY-like chemotaxis protein
MTDKPTAPPCPRALIIDDDTDHQALLVDAMEMYFTSTEDSQLRCASTGAEALEQTIKNFDVVLLDLHLPDINGLDLLAEILTRAGIPVLIVTGENDSGTAARAIELGAQDYICKHGDYLLAIPPLVQKNISLHRSKRNTTAWKSACSGCSKNFRTRTSSSKSR